MKRLIEQAFLHVEVIGPHVFDGHYDLVMKETGCIVMPRLWDAAVKPGCSITMHMWPLPALSPPPLAPPRVVPIFQPPPAPRPRSLSSSSDSDSSDLGSLFSDSTIEDEPEDLGIDIDFGKEEENAELSLSELLKRWTNATDTLGHALCSECDWDDKSSDSGSSLMDD
jgi:hypothetical protein